MSHAHACILITQTSIHNRHLSKAGSIDWLHVATPTEVGVVFIDGTARETYAVFIPVGALKPLINTQTDNKVRFGVGGGAKGS